MANDPTDGEFLLAYNSGGLASAYYACLVVALVYGAFAFAALWGGIWTIIELVVRGLILISLAALALCVRFFPEVVIRYYQNILFGISFFVLVSTVFLIFFGEILTRYSVLGGSSTIIFGLFLHYAFLRLTALRSLVIGLSVSVLFFMGVLVEAGFGEFSARVFIYLVGCNLAGFLLRRTIFAREKALFRAKVGLKEAEVFANDRALEAEREFLERVRLMNAIDHDLRQPLFAADVHARAVSKVLVGSDDDAVTQSMRDLRAALGLVRRTLDHVKWLSASDRAGDALVTEVFSISVVFDGLRGVVEAEAQKSGVRFAWFSDLGDPRIESNVGALSQILLNLTLNAVKFSAAYRRSSARAGVAVRLRNGFVQIRVYDNGCGIPRSERRRVWLAYARGERDGNAQRVDGVGLGLYLVGRMVGLLRGHKISLLSKVGRGSIFRLTLPVATIAAPRASETVSVRGAFALFVGDSGDGSLSETVAELEGAGVLVDVYPSIGAIPPDVIEDRPMDLLVILSNSVSAPELTDFVRSLRVDHGRSPVVMGTDALSKCFYATEFRLIADGERSPQVFDALRDAVLLGRRFEASD